MIPTYDPNPDYLARALAAVLEQDPGPATMEIALVDDGSRAVDPRESVPAGARDRVSWFPGHGHAGIGRNWNACIQHARGRWVHILHQDDLVLKGFYERLRAGITSAPAVGAAFCRDVIVDTEGKRVGGQRFIRSTPGIVEDWIEHVFVGLDLRASALVVKRDVYEAIGGFRLDLQYALDWDMWKRIAAAYPLWHEPEPLACYRRHRGRATRALMRTGTNIAEIGRSIELSASLLPPSVAASATRRARDYYTEYAVLMAWRALADGDVRSSVAQIREARGLASTARVTWEIGRFAGYSLWRARAEQRQKKADA
jgi:glycosyltransferase involved in cell wall biosynthesis